MITPSVSRKVWYRPSQRDKDGTAGEVPTTGKMEVHGDEPLDATIIAVWGDRLINVCIKDIYGTIHARRSVKLLQEGDEVPISGGYAQWMPYQQGQAKKDAQPAAESPSASEPPTFALRLVVECGDLSEKTSKLAAFIGTPAYLALTQEQQTRLSHQLNIMRQYLAILNERIAELATSEAAS